MTKLHSRLMGVALAGAAALGFATVAMADGAPRGSLKDYQPAPAFTWTGLYIGGHLGGAWSNIDFSKNQPGVGLVEPLSFSPSAFVGGGQVGYQMQFGNIVAGVELSYTVGEMSESKPSAVIANRTRSVSLDNIFMATARLGTTWDRWLGYVKGGYASANLDIDSNVTSTGVATSASSGRENGWTIGAGIEYAFTNNLIFGAEYDFIRFSPSDRFGTQVNGFAIQNNQSIDADIHMLVARLSYKFGP